MSQREFRLAGRFRRDQRGAAAAEFVLVLPLLIILMLTITDFGLYIYAGMEVSTAAENAAQAIYVTCAGTGNVPAAGNCSYAGAETAAAQHSPLGNRVRIRSTTENYYCVNSSGTLVALSGTFPGNKAPDCTSVDASNNDSPGDYVVVTVSVTYRPAYSGFSLASMFAGPITRTVWMRLA